MAELFDFLDDVGTPPPSMAPPKPITDAEREFGGIRKLPEDVVGSVDWIKANILPMIAGSLGGGEKVLMQALKQRQAVQGALKFFRPTSASVKDLTTARNVLLKKAHPDVAGPQGTEATKKINEQWDILKGNVDFLK